MRDSNLAGVKTALEAGESANWSPEASYPPPIAVATFANDEGTVKVLLEQGADPDIPVTVEIPFLRPRGDYDTSVPGERALHVAARSWKIEIVRLLLQRSHVDPNVTAKGAPQL